MSFNTFIIISCETLQKLQSQSLIKICGCSYITSLLLHLALDFGHANVAEKAASQAWTTDLALGQFVKTVWSWCGISVSTRLRVRRDVELATVFHGWEIQTLCWKCIFKPEPFQGRHLHVCWLSCRWTPKVQQRCAPHVVRRDDPFVPSQLLCHALPVNEQTSSAQRFFRCLWNTAKLIRGRP